MNSRVSSALHFARLRRNQLRREAFLPLPWDARPTPGGQIVPGDTVCFMDGCRYRVLSIAPDTRRTVAGTWLVVDERGRYLTIAQRSRPFRLWARDSYAVQAGSR